LEDCIHVIWYVVNAASGRFEPFEARLLRELFKSVPVLFVLNKADVASSKQLRDIQRTIQSLNLKNCLGVHKVVSDRKNFSQSWCPECFGEDICFKKTSLKIFCDDCEKVTLVRSTYGLDALIQQTTSLLPDLAKEAFLSAQRVSYKQKNERAKDVVKYYSSKIRMDIHGIALKDVGIMVAKIFILWGWNLLGGKVSQSLVREMTLEYKGQEFFLRIAMVIADTILHRQLSRSVIACLGVTVNRPLRQLYSLLLAMVEKHEPIDIEMATKMIKSVEGNQDFADEFIKKVFELGTEETIELYWEEDMVFPL